MLTALILAALPVGSFVAIFVATRCTDDAALTRQQFEANKFRDQRTSGDES